MNIILILGVAAAIIVGVLVLRLLKSVLKAFFAFLSIIALLALIFGLVAYSDVKQLSQLNEGEKWIVFANDGKALAGVSIPEGLSLRSLDPLSTRLLSSEELSFLFSSDNSSSVNDTLVVVFSEEALPETINLSFSSLSRSDYVAAFSDPSSVFSSEVTNGKVDDVLATKLLVLSGFASITSQGSEFLLGSLRNGSLSIYPPLLSIKLLGYVPDSVLSSFSGNFNLSLIASGVS